jgi:hypothetical protein
MCQNQRMHPPSAAHDGSQVVLRRPLSPAEVKDLADAVYYSGLKLVTAVAVPTSGVLVMGIAVLVAIGFGVVAGRTAVFIVLGIGFLVWLLVLALGLGGGVALGVAMGRSRLESRMGPHRELVTTWYPHGFALTDWKGSVFIPFSELRSVRRAGRQGQFIVVRTPMKLGPEPYAHGIPVDLVPENQLRRWNV